MSIEMTDVQEEVFLPADIGKQREEAPEIVFMKEHYRYFAAAASPVRRFLCCLYVSESCGNYISFYGCSYVRILYPGAEAYGKKD